MIKKRESLRKEKRFADADNMRLALREKHGIILEDTEYGPMWYMA